MKNVERASATRARLIAVARPMFGGLGYAGTATEAVLREAGVARGALYHHFADKAALFEAVCLAVCEDIVPAVDEAAAARRDPLDALVHGSIRWIEKTSEPEARRILMIDAPTVLGWERWQRWDLTSKQARQKTWERDGIIQLDENGDGYIDQEMRPGKVPGEYLIRKDANGSAGSGPSLR